MIAATPVNDDPSKEIDMLTLKEEAGGKLLSVTISGKLAKEDYQHFVPMVDRLIKEHGKIRILVQMHDFHGWEMAALWEDIKFDVKHFADIERLALVGETKWQAGMAKFCKPFTKAKIEYFDETQIDRAREWIAEGLPKA
jgi:SpoIIAA-like